MIYKNKGDEVVVTIKNYLVAKDLEEAYEVLNKNRNNVILGGMLWLKMCKKNINIAIDLSELGLNQIVETSEAIEIGCMTSLRQLEKSEVLQNHFDGLVAKSVQHIVGTQFRNTATVGGSIFSRFGFSDILTALLALDTYVVLHRGGVVALEEFILSKREKDVLVKIIIKKNRNRASYQTHRNTATDIPNLVVCVGKSPEGWKIAVGARPHKAKRAHEAEALLGELPTGEMIEDAAEKVVQELDFGTNLRASKAYRELLAKVLVQRGIEEISSVGQEA